MHPEKRNKYPFEAVTSEKKRKYLFFSRNHPKKSRPYLFLSEVIRKKAYEIWIEAMQSANRRDISYFRRVFFRLKAMESAPKLKQP